MTRARVLFVDDEPRILDGLRRSLRGKRGEWEMSFVTSGADALELLAAAPHDVVVSDMRMPGMDGAELLTHVSDRHPEVARVVLSGHTEPEAAIKVAIAAHRFLTKPSDAESVIGVVEQLTVRTSATHPAEARRIAGGVRCLPMVPAYSDRMMALLRRPDIELTDVVRPLAHDIGFTAKLLQLSASAFFGARPRIAASVNSVVNALGLPMVQALAEASQARWSPVAWQPAIAAELAVSWRHAAATAILADAMASPANRPYAQAAALLQDVGRFVCLAGAAGDACPGGADAAAQRCYGVPYREIAVELLHLWGLPTPILTAVAQRDLDHRPPCSGLGVAAAVRAAHLLLQQTESRDPSDGTHDDELALLLTHPQLTAQAVDWRAAAERASAEAGRHLAGDGGGA
ncbi:Response regulator receiver domain-containing protein [Micromonospora pattaloongensis]|uniref:Response regulator receiver domain-containing protein n=1 Tax=Micromonospora pattaloongensis TaxID=405436 RepID=A0A1H3QUS7_9ACTN|nr:HDOD domain-containing protein [Micromonospora pattaloongensis]SDZ17080.1 Response regulator receiver domain-containing protein [Micromonospora pattaloongensis]